MNIWIFNHHALTPDMSGGTRHYDFAKELVKRGHSVTIVASSFHYSKYKEMKVYKEKDYLKEELDGVKFIWIQTPPYFSNGMSRVKNMLSYSHKVWKIIPRLNLETPDVIIGSSVHLFAVYTAYKLAKKYKVPFIMEVRDIWPQTLIDMGVSKYHPFVLLLGVLEKFLYKRADKIISNLPYAFEHIRNFTDEKKVEWISNGVDLSNNKYVEKEETKKFIVSYTGSIGIANNLQILINLAERLKAQKDIYFRIIGEGGEKKKLQNLVQAKKINNIIIENAVKKADVVTILKESDVLFLSLKDSPLYKFGISLNKLFDYMAAGRVVVFSGNPKNNPLYEADSGYVIEPDNIDKLETVILKIYDLSQSERNKQGAKIRKYVEEYYSIDVLTNKLETLLLNQIKVYNA